MKYIIEIILIVLLYSCSIINEPDISSRKVILLAPPDSFITSMSTQTFWWEPVEDASGYNLQIIKPNISSPEYLILDTNIVKNTFSFSLFPGEYEWRVRAFNFAYSTLYYSRSLTINDTSSLTGQYILLIAPQNNLYTNNLSLDFSWHPIYNADSYIFEIRTPDWNGITVFGPIQIHTTITNIQLSENSYAWGVKAVNDISESLLSIREFIIDTTSPSKPTLLFPENNSIIRDTPITFRWEHSSPSDDLQYDSIWIAGDSLFLPTIIDTVLRYFGTSEIILDFSNEKNDTLYWRVQSFDRAGNKSFYSNISSFIVLVDEKNK